MDNKHLYNKAFKLIESWRYKFGVSTAIRLFVAEWAYQQSGLYPVNDKMVETEEFKAVSIPLTHILSELMMKGESDPLAVILSEFCKEDNKHLSYYPTPKGITVLLNQMISHDRDYSEPLSIYEPCCGSAGMILQKIELVYQQNIKLDDPLGNLTVVVEDVSSVALHAFFIQLAFKLNYLEEMGGKPALPKHITITQIDVLSRKRTGPVYYELSSPKQASAPELLAIEAQKALQAL